MEQTKYTVFATCVETECDSFECNTELSGASTGQSLQDLITYFIEEGFTPKAWAMETPEMYGGTKGWKALCAESIAAGRTIDYIGGRYVPRGVQEDKPKEGEDFPRTLSDFLCRARMIPPFSIRVGATEKKHPRLTWADSKPVDRFDGFVVESRSYRFSEDDASRAPRHVTQSSPDLAGEWKPFEFGSAHLKG